MSFFEEGRNYFIRTVTHHHVGTFVRLEREGRDLILRDVSWIADDGRFMNALRDGSLNEVEPFPDDAEVLINRDTIIDATVWTHALPRKQV